MISERWTRVRTLGRGASGAEVFLAADDKSGELFAVKSACASGTAALRREQAIMSALRSPRLVSCLGGRGGRDGSYQLFLEFAPGGSLADEVARVGVLDESAVRAYAADVAAGLAYLHGAGTVHGDVKARNVVIGADGRAKLTDFGCARKAGAGPIIGGTPAFMAPEVVRGEEQGPAADVWALGCTVVEMATGRAPWSSKDGDALAAMHRIGYTDAVPEVPQWMSAEAKDFLGLCLVRRASDRCTAAELLEHPFLAAAVLDTKLEAVEGKWVSPKSTLDAAFWESESDGDDELFHSTADRIKELACPASAVPDWDSDEGWIDVLSAAPTEVSDAVSVPAEETTDLDDAMASEEQAADSAVLDITMDSSVLNVGEANCDSVWEHNPHQSLEISVCHELVGCKLFCNRSMNTIDFVPAETLCFALFLCFFAHSYSFLLFSNFSARTSTAPMTTRSLSKVPAISWQVQLTNTVTPRRVAVTLVEKIPGRLSTRKAQRHGGRTS
jgi:serine/threonine protein kinase